MVCETGTQGHNIIVKMQLNDRFKIVRKTQIYKCKFETVYCANDMEKKAPWPFLSYFNG